MLQYFQIYNFQIPCCQYYQAQNVFVLCITIHVQWCCLHRHIKLLQSLLMACCLLVQVHQPTWGHLIVMSAQTHCVVTVAAHALSPASGGWELIIRWKPWPPISKYYLELFSDWHLGHRLYKSVDISSCITDDNLALDEQMTWHVQAPRHCLT